MKNNQIFDEAAEWIVKMQSAPLTDKERQHFDEWRKKSVLHAQAWHKAELFLQHLGHFPEQGYHILQKSHSAARINMASKFILAFFMCFAMGALWTSDWKDYYFSDYSTKVGESKHIELEDGTHIDINTQTAFDQKYSATQRQLILHYGEIQVKTGHEFQHLYRPFTVSTSDADMLALGTVFNVQHLKNKQNHTCVAVIESAVKITLKQNQKYTMLNQGEQICFDADHFEPKQPLNSNTYTWKNGVIMADELTLESLLTEVGRYHHGHVHIQSELRQLKVSGSYPVNDLHALGKALALSYPIQFDSYLSDRIVHIKKDEKSERKN
ncbi:FecR domain-containing protein [Acinetobacter stercoris]|uniref:Fec operon regulator FecR n=1 Tax=Acinetobacter stercoris TaxID=2126983 RepID=A0A2U3MUE5_9GAMM|nr:FecR domain-containing protein [Acinetobacter stercoris]SPL69041.1 fec operon regulator FecR [Acinetobacter stercoris]